MAFQTTSLFPATSYFDEDSRLPAEPRLADIEPRIAAADQSRAISNSDLEDWAYRLARFADEAQDEGLDVLHSNLLDLRDEILVELHSNL